MICADSVLGAEARGPAAEELFGIGRPDLDFVVLARSMGVPGRRAEDAETFTAALREALAEPGPRLIEARIRRCSISAIAAMRSFSVAPPSSRRRARPWIAAQ